MKQMTVYVTKTVVISVRLKKFCIWYLENSSTLYLLSLSLHFLHRLSKQRVNYCIAQAMFIQARGAVYETKVHTHNISHLTLFLQLYEQKISTNE